jgi:hypothetical protein
MLEHGVLVVMGPLRHVHLAPDLGDQLVQGAIGQRVADGLRGVIGQEQPLELFARHAARQSKRDAGDLCALDRRRARDDVAGRLLRQSSGGYDPQRGRVTDAQ